jgi:hypothetical protein
MEGLGLVGYGSEDEEGASMSEGRHGWQKPTQQQEADVCKQPV